MAAACSSCTQPLLLAAEFPAENTYYISYFDFLKSATSITVPYNAFLEFDEFIPSDSATYAGSVDMYSSTWADLRDFTSPSTGEFIRDENYLRVHPFSDVNAFANGQWYHRKFDMGSAAGELLTEACLATDTGNGTNGAPANLAGSYNGYIDNVVFTNAYGELLQTLYADGAGSINVGGGAVTSSTTAFGGASAASATNNQVSVVSGFSLGASPSSAQVGTTINLTASLQLPGGAGIPNANVALGASRPQDTLSASTGVSAANGDLVVTVGSTLAGPGQVTATAGPFTAVATYTFLAGPAVAWSFIPASQTAVVGPNASVTTLSVAAVDQYGNVAVTGRVMQVSSADTQLLLSTDGVNFVAAPTGVTLSAGSGTASVYVEIGGGAYRSAVLTASDFVGGAGALSTGTSTVIVNPNPAVSLALSLPVSATAGAPVELSITAVDASGDPANSGVSISLSSLSPTGLFSPDMGSTWESTVSAPLVNGGWALLYKDSAAGLSTVDAASSLNNASINTTIVAGPAFLVSGSAIPVNICNNGGCSPDTSVLDVQVVDAYGNPVSNTAVAFLVVDPAAGPGTLSAANATTAANGIADVTFTASATQSMANYVRGTVGSLKPCMININTAKPTRLNLSPNPATGGIGVATQFTLLAQNGANPAVTGYSADSIEISSTAATLVFSSSSSGPFTSTLTLNLNDGQAVFFAEDSQSTGAGGVTITATDQSGGLSLGTALYSILPANLVVYQVSSPLLHVQQGENSVTVEMTVSDTGGISASVSDTVAAINLSFTAGGTAEASQFTVSPLAGNPTTIPAGGTAYFYFLVDISFSALTGTTIINGNIVGSADGDTINAYGADLTGTWIVGPPIHTPTPSLTYTITPTISPTATPSPSPSQTQTITPSATPSFTISPTFTSTLVPTWTPTVTPNQTQTQQANQTATAVAGQTQTAVASTATAVAGQTQTAVAGTATAVAGQTQTAVAGTETAVAGQTQTAVAQATETAVAGQTQTAVAGTETAVAGQTQTAVVQATETAVAGQTQTAVAGTETAVAGQTQTAVVQATETAVAGQTQTAVAGTETAVAGQTETAVVQATETAVAGEQTQTAVAQATETAVAAQATETAVAAQQTETAVAAQQTETAVAAQQTETAVAAQQTETAVAAQQTETAVAAQQTETAVAAQQTQTAVAAQKTQTAMNPAVTPGSGYVYPSPVMGGTAHFAYYMSEPGTVSIRVWNSAAELAATIQESKQSGNQTSSLDMGSFAAGHYFYIIEMSYDSGNQDKLKPSKFDVVR